MNTCCNGDCNQGRDCVARIRKDTESDPAGINLVTRLLIVGVLGIILYSIVQVML